MADFKLTLILTTFATILLGFSGILMAEPAVQAAPPTAVDTAELPPVNPKGPVVVELFSSQACLFCPKADAYLNALARKDNIIALACHVDYFDIKDGSLAQEFCTQRQNQYSRTLRSGPKYTPQMVINGRYDAIGYKKDKVDAAIFKAASEEIKDIQIAKVKDNTFKLTMPAIETGQYSLWVAVTNTPIERSIIIGKNKGQSVLYEHIVSDLTSPMIWSGDTRSFDLTADFGDNKQSVAVWAQNQITGDIVAAGQYKKPDA